MKNHKQGFDSIAIKDHPGENNAHVPPIYATSTFTYESPEKIMQVFKGQEDAFVYSRWSNPNLEVIESKISSLETFGSDTIEAQSYLFSSGMAAISGLLQVLVHSGDTIVTQGNLYGATTELMNAMTSNGGIEVVFMDLHNLENLQDLLKQNSRISLIYLETPSNPTINAYDIKSISEIARKYDCKVAVDNTFSSPYLQQPLLCGADFVLHSATKYLNGHGTALSGLIVSRDIEFAKDHIWNIRKLYGGVCSPFDAWLLNNGLKTLSLRMDRHCSNARQLASYLQDHEAISKVNYLGLSDHPDHLIASAQMKKFGGVLSFELKEGLKAGMSLMKNIRFCTLTATLGTPDTLISHPASMTHVNVDAAQRRKYGITDGLIRMSVGLENFEDIKADLDQALKN